MATLYNEKDYNDEELVKLIAKEQNVLRDLNREIIKQGETIEYLEYALRRRQLAAYWKAHPTLTPVAVWDKLLVTRAFHDTVVKLNCWPIGTELTIEQLNYQVDDDDTEGLTAYVRGSDGFTGIIYDWQIDVARTAWLAANASDESGVRDGE